MAENIEKIIQSCGAELYDTESVVENDKKIFRVLITASEGVNLDKCEQISKILSPIFDLNPPISGQYYLEVSSPGIERALRLPKHFKASIGENAKIKPNEGESFVGKVLSADDEGVEIEGVEGKILYSNIKKARTYFEW